MAQKTFPRYSRLENRSCKLTDDDIAEIKIRREAGETYTQLAREFNVSVQGIFYWCMPEDKRKEINARKETKRGKPYDFRAYRERKKLLHPELVEYERATIHAQKERDIISFKKRAAKNGNDYMVKNRQKIYALNKVWRSKNREYLRQMAEWYRGKRKIKPIKENEKTL